MIYNRKHSWDSDPAMFVDCSWSKVEHVSRTVKQSIIGTLRLSRNADLACGNKSKHLYLLSFSSAGGDQCKADQSLVASKTSQAAIIEQGNSNRHRIGAVLPKFPDLSELNLPEGLDAVKVSGSLQILSAFQALYKKRRKWWAISRWNRWTLRRFRCLIKYLLPCWNSYLLSGRTFHDDVPGSLSESAGCGRQSELWGDPEPSGLLLEVDPISSIVPALVQLLHQRRWHLRLHSLQKHRESAASLRSADLSWEVKLWFQQLLRMMNWFTKKKKKKKKL